MFAFFHKFKIFQNKKLGEIGGCEQLVMGKATDYNGGARELSRVMEIVYLDHSGG